MCYPSFLSSCIEQICQRKLKRESRNTILKNKLPEKVVILCKIYSLPTLTYAEEMEQVREDRL
jgi:hypothetical protein